MVVAVGDFHSQYNKTHPYRLDIYDESGLVASQELNAEEMNYFAFDASADSKFYRANIYDVTSGKLFAVGNPVWNKK